MRRVRLLKRLENDARRDGGSDEHLREQATHDLVLVECLKRGMVGLGLVCHGGFQREDRPRTRPCRRRGFPQADPIGLEAFEDGIAVRHPDERS
jgi:hypothetical protein